MRYSERFFTSEVISEKVVREAVVAANQRPTSCNLQLNKFLYLTRAEDLDFIRQHVTRKANWCQSLLVVTFERGLTWERDANAISAGIVVEGLIAELSERGIQSCPIAGFYGEAALRQRFGISKELAIPLLIFVGSRGLRPKGYIKPYRTKAENIFFADYMPPDFLCFPVSRKLERWDSNQIREYRARLSTVYADRDTHAPFDVKYYSSILELVSRLNVRSVTFVGTPPFRLLRSFCEDNTDLSVSVLTTSALVPYARIELTDIASVGSFDSVTSISEGINGLICEFDLLNTYSDHEISRLRRSYPSGSTLICGALTPLSVFGLYYVINTLFNRHAYHNHIFYKAGGFRLCWNKPKHQQQHWFAATGYASKVLERLRLPRFISQFIPVNDLRISEQIVD